MLWFQKKNFSYRLNLNVAKSLPHRSIILEVTAIFRRAWWIYPAPLGLIKWTDIQTDRREKKKNCFLSVFSSVIQFFSNLMTFLPVHTRPQVSRSFWISWLSCPYIPGLKFQDYSPPECFFLMIVFHEKEKECTWCGIDGIKEKKKNTPKLS